MFINFNNFGKGMRWFVIVGLIIVMPLICANTNISDKGIETSGNYTGSWFKGLFNWISGDYFTTFNGSTLLINETYFNISVINVINNSGSYYTRSEVYNTTQINSFNTSWSSTYNSTYDAKNSSLWISDGTNISNRNSGYVGIGTNSPQSTLELYSSGHTTLRIRTSGTSFDPGIQFREASNVTNYFSLGADMGLATPFFSMNPSGIFGAVGLGIDKNGNVGIGTQTPSEELHLYKGDNSITLTEKIEAGGTNSVAELYLQGTGDASASQIIIRDNDAGKQWHLINRASNSNAFMLAYYDGSFSYPFTLLTNGNLGIGTITPSTKLYVNGSVNVSSVSDVCIDGGNCLSKLALNSSLSNLSTTMNYTNIAMTNQSNTFASGYQQNFLDNVTMNNYNFLVNNKICLEGNNFGSDICGNGFSHKNTLNKGLYYTYSNITDLLGLFGITGITSDVYASVLVFEQDTTPVPTDVGDFYKDTVSSMYFITNNGTDRVGKMTMSSDGLSLGMANDDIYKSSAGEYFMIFGDDLGNNVFLIDPKDNYNVKIGSSALSYKTNLKIDNGNASISDCISLGGQAICNWNGLSAYGVGNSSWNQSVADSLYLRSPLNLSDNTKTNGILKTNRGGLGIDASGFGNNSFLVAESGDSSFKSFSPANNGILMASNFIPYWNTTAQSTLDTAYHSNRANLDTINQNMATSNDVAFDSLKTNGTVNVGGANYGIVSDYEVWAKQRLRAGNKNTGGVGEYLRVYDWINETTGNTGAYLYFDINDTKGGQYYGVQAGGNFYSNSNTFQPNAYDVHFTCRNTSGVTINTTANQGICEGFRIVHNIGAEVTAYELRGSSSSIVGSTASYGNKAYYVGSGGVWIQDSGKMTPRFITSSGFGGSIILKNSVESAEGTIYGAHGLFQTLVNYNIPSLIARANYNEAGNRMNMNVSTVENRFNQTVWAVDDLGNEVANGTITSNGLKVNGDINLTGNLIVGGNMSIKRPYGMFSSTQTQTVAVANTAYVMSFNWTEDAYQVVKANDNKNFSFQQTGDYLIELSIMGTSAVANKHLEIWFQKNGVNVARSNTRYEFKGVNSEAVLAVPFILDMNTTDSMRIMYAGDDTGVSLPYTTNTSYSPETPSAIMTITKISEITT